MEKPKVLSIDNLIWIVTGCMCGLLLYVNEKASPVVATMVGFAWYAMLIINARIMYIMEKLEEKQ